MTDALANTVFVRNALAMPSRQAMPSATVIRAPSARTNMLFWEWRFAVVSAPVLAV